MGEEFDTTVKDNKIVIVDFTATWCPPCQRIGPVFVSISEEADMSDVVFVKVDVDANKEAAEAAGITCMPTFQLFKDGTMVDSSRAPRRMVFGLSLPSTSSK